MKGPATDVDRAMDRPLRRDSHGGTCSDGLPQHHSADPAPPIGRSGRGQVGERRPDQDHPHYLDVVLGRQARGQRFGEGTFLVDDQDLDLHQPWIFLREQAGVAERTLRDRRVLTPARDRGGLEPAVRA